MTINFDAVSDLSSSRDIPNPTFLWAIDGKLLWANAAAAAYWGVSSRAALLALDFSKHPVQSQLMQAFRALPQNAMRLERLRLAPFGRLALFTARVRRLALPDGTDVLLVTGLDKVPAERITALEAAERTAPSPVDATPPASDEAMASEPPPVADAALHDTPLTAHQPEPAAPEAEDNAISVAADHPQASELSLAAGEAALPLSHAPFQPITARGAAPADRPIAATMPGIVATALDVVAAVKAVTDVLDHAGDAAPAPIEPNASEIAAPSPAVPPAALAPSIVAPAEEPAHTLDLIVQSERAAAILARIARPLRFVWESDSTGRLTYVSREFVGAVGAEAMPDDEESFAAFALRHGADAEGKLEAALASRTAWAEIMLLWPIAQSAERAEVELTAAPMEGPDGFLGYRGFGLVRGLTPPTPATAPEALPRRLPDAGEPLAATNVLSFPGNGNGTERKLEPEDAAALRTIARVLGGPIGVPSEPAPTEPAAVPSEAEPIGPPLAQPDSEHDETRTHSVADVVAELASLGEPGPTEEEAPEQAAAPPDAPSALPAAATPAHDGIAELLVVQAALDASRAREAELRSILDTATDGVIVLAADGRILSLNRAAEALFGVEGEDVAGLPLTQLLAPDSHRVASDYLEGIVHNGVASVLNDGREVVGIEKNGGRIPLFMTIGRASVEPVAAKFCAVLRDITHWKTVERDLIDAKREAERASQHKSEFLAKISHEIRTPLNAIIGFSEMMMQERFGMLQNERYRGYIADIHSAGEHLMGLVNDLLDLSKIEAGKLELTFSAVKLADIVQQAVTAMQPQANRDGVILRTSLPHVRPVIADARSLRQILFNLLSNAIKFTRAGGQVIVSTAATDDGEVTLRVRDTGIGMSEREITTALEPFRQISVSNRVEMDGTGLGLPLTKALAEANRASFTIESAPDVGTLVQITFPATRVLAE